MVEKALCEFDVEEEDSFSLPSLSFDGPFSPSLQRSLPREKSGLHGKETGTRSEGNRSYEPFIQEASRRYQVDPVLVRAVIRAESGGDPSAVSSAGAQGLMQLMPATAVDLGVKDVFDPYENIMAGTSYLRQLLDRYHGEVKLALAAYNWGQGNVERRPEAMPRETKNYIAKVESYYRSERKPFQTG
ncbi:MAG TPA: lytic transglycosylase domain-containing protein [Thermodesulfobacteriota bacterium]|nr:lytic transglycosylase domain-containing protein [Thermodesulfobacteriota bacterium]